MRQFDGDLAESLRALASHALDTDQLQKLARLLDRARADGQPLVALASFRLGIVTNSTADFITPAIVGSGLRYGLAIECVTAEYGQVMQTALDPDSAVNAARCDAVVLALDAHSYALATAPGDDTAAQVAIERALAQVDTMARSIGKHCPTLIVQTVPPPVPPQRVTGFWRVRFAMG